MRGEECGTDGGGDDDVGFFIVFGRSDDSTLLGLEGLMFAFVLF